MSQTITFTPTSAVSRVRVNLLDDNESEGVEEFSAEIFLVDEALGEPGSVGEVMVQIMDDESKEKWGCLCYLQHS